MSDRFDLVFMWVDDRWPGYGELLDSYAHTRHDRNPNRTRDNLETLKFGLRSVARYAPWRRNIHLVTCRPQVPAWLNRAHPDIRIVHHDEFMPREILPTFNSFAIQMWLHALPGLSERFVCFDDDMLLVGPTSLEDFVAAEGRPRYHFKDHLPSTRAARNARLSPWNAALANGAALLDEIAPGPHPGFLSGPKLFDRRDCVDIIGRWPDTARRTSNSRFRAHDNWAFEALLPQYLVARGRAEAASTADTTRTVAYVGLENIAIWNRYLLGHVGRRRPTFLTLNDNFGAHPRPGAVAVARRFLETAFPDPSPYEIASTAST
jgi:hypothetical protein